MYKIKSKLILLTVTVVAGFATNPIISMQKQKAQSTSGKLAPMAARDFNQEYIVLERHLAQSSDSKHQEVLSEQIEKLESDAKQHGVLIGSEAASARKELERLRSAALLSAQYKELQVREVALDAEAYAAEIQNVKNHAPVAGSLEALLLLEEEQLYVNQFTNAVRNLQIKAQIESEQNQNVLRSLRHLVHKFQDAKRAKSSKEVGELSDLKNAINLKLAQ